MSTTSPTPDHAGQWIVTAFGNPSVLRWKTFDPPTPVNDQVLIRALVTGISGVDNMMRTGEFPHPLTSKPGFVPGQECVGRIEAIGPDVSGLRVGELVVSFCFLGAYATHVLVSASDVVPLDENDDPVKIVALPLNYMTAYGLLTRSVGNIPPGSSVLVGSVSGGIGTAIAQIAKTFNMGLTLYGTCSPSKFDYVKSLGVTPIDRFTDDLVAAVKKLTDGKGVDVAFDAVGTEDSIRASVAATKENVGQVVVYGWLDAVAAKKGTDVPETGSNTYASLDAFIKSGAVPRTKFWAIAWDYYSVKEDYFRDLNRIIEAVRNGTLNPVVGKLFRLSDAVLANSYLVSSAGVRGKMEFIVDAELAKLHGL